MCRSILRVMLFCLNSPSKKHAVSFRPNGPLESRKLMPAYRLLAVRDCLCH